MSTQMVEQAKQEIEALNAQLCELQQSVLSASGSERKLMQKKAVEMQQVIDNKQKDYSFLRDGPGADIAEYTDIQVENWLKGANNRLCELQTKMVQGQSPELQHQIDDLERAIDIGRRGLKQKRKQEADPEKQQLVGELEAAKKELQRAHQKVTVIIRCELEGCGPQADAARDSMVLENELERLRAALKSSNDECTRFRKESQTMQHAIERERKVLRAVCCSVVSCIQVVATERQKNQELSKLVAQQAAAEQRGLQMSYR